MTETQQSQEGGKVVCHASKDPYIRLFIVTVFLIGLGAYTVYDHYILGNYPMPEPYSLNPYLKYLFNHYIPFLLIPIGLVLLLFGIAGMRRIMEADQEGIGYRGKSKTAWKSIKRVDSSRLKSKGILDLYDDAGGRIRLDSWYMTKFSELVAFVEQHLPPEVMPNK